MSLPLSRRGFTLIELLVVIAIIAVLVAILLPAVQQAREASRASSCRNNLKQFGIALHSYAETHSRLPMGAMGRPTTTPATGNNFAFHVLLLPYMDQTALYNKFDFNLHYNSGPNYALKEVAPSFLQCPSSRTADQSMSESSPTAHIAQVAHYYGVAGPKGTNPVTAAAWPMQATTGAANDHGGFASSGLLIRNVAYRLADATDGLTNTFLMGEVSAETAPGWSSIYRPWTQGASNDAAAGASYAMRNVSKSINRYSGYSGNTSGRLYNDVAFSSQHVGGAHFMLGDGSVRFLSENIDFVTYQIAASKDDNINRTLD
jgi:prepilin-type N-terminal cleavage/methylation domain-containing protein